MDSELLFANKTVIVTGGTKGLGYGVAQDFLQHGAQVVVCARQPVETLPAIGSDQALFQALDVRDADATQALVDFALAETGRLDILINNAGGSPEVASADASPRFTSAILATNLVAPAVLSQQAYQAMVASSGHGSIVNIASVSAVRPSPGTSAYGAAKAGLLNLTQSLAQEWAPAVRVNAIIAGLARTENSLEHYGGEEGLARIEAGLPMGRMAKAEDIAAACRYLCSEQAAYVSGACLAVHGGGEPPSFLTQQKAD